LQTCFKSKPFTTLRRLRLGYFDSFSLKLFKDIRTMAPNMNELHLPCDPALTREHVLEVALGMCEPKYVQMDRRPPP
jgi:hypothetical protein